MAYHDWNGNGEKDKLDDNIAYRFFEDRKGGPHNKKKIKKATTLIIFAVVACLLYALFAPVVMEPEADVLWQHAFYHEDTQLGDGVNHFVLEVVAGGKSVSFEISSDKDTVGAALTEHNLISGEQGPYGLYIKYVNGIFADYDTDQSYWSFTKGGQYMQTGVDGEPITNGAHYELVYTK